MNTPRTVKKASRKNRIGLPETPEDGNAQRFAEAVVRRMIESARSNPDGITSLDFTEDMVNEAMVEIGVSPINGQPIAEQETVRTDGTVIKK